MQPVREVSWFRTPMLSHQRTLLNPYLAQDPIDLDYAISGPSQCIVNLELVTAGHTFSRDPEHEAPFQKCRKVPHQFNWCKRHLSNVILYSYSLVDFANNNPNR